MGIRFIFGWISFYTCCGFAASSQAAPTAADSCSPTYLQIYDFHVGDVFQDMRSVSSGGGAVRTASSTTVYRKYSIVSKETLAKGFRYGVAGLSHQVVSNKTGLMPNSPVTTTHAYDEIKEDWEFLDTASHALNACKDRIVPLKLYSYSPEPFAYSRVIIAGGEKTDFPIATDSIRLKILGQNPASMDGNLYEDSAGKTVRGSTPLYSAVYAAGLGCVSMKINFGESVSEQRLEGRARGRDVIGGISPDETFLPPGSARLPSRASAREPKPILRGREGWFFLTKDGSGYRDLNGARNRLIRGTSLSATPGSPVFGDRDYSKSSPSSF